MLKLTHTNSQHTIIYLYGGINSTVFTSILGILCTSICIFSIHRHFSELKSNTNQSQMPYIFLLIYLYGVYIVTKVF